MQIALVRVNQILEPMMAEERMCWALENLPGGHAISSSFGIQSAVMLHLMSSQQARIPVILIDTGYLFPEVHIAADRLSVTESVNQLLEYLLISGVLKAGYAPVSVSA